MDALDYRYELASPRHRLAGLLIDGGLAIVTFGIGWLIWTFIILGSGQTPGKKIVKLRVYNQSTGEPVRWGHMFIRTFGLNFVFGIAAQIVGGIINSIMGIHLATISPNATKIHLSDLGVFNSGAITMIQTAGFLIDAFWIFKGGQRHRIVDIICKTDVVNEAKLIPVSE
jgi:uncharacterized RDD family membrane protein YckC